MSGTSENGLAAIEAALLECRKSGLTNEQAKAIGTLATVMAREVTKAEARKAFSVLPPMERN